MLGSWAGSNPTAIAETQNPSIPRQDIEIPLGIELFILFP
jgi:hypothetical protein